MTQTQQLETLNHRQCLDRLQQVRVGRLVFTEDGVPAIHPVNFRVWQGDVVLRVAGGPKLEAATSHQVVAFEADELDADLRNGWSVTVVGTAEPVTAIDDLVDVAGTFIEPWVQGRREHFIRIRTDRITGRQFREDVTPQYRP